MDRTTTKPLKSQIRTDLLKLFTNSDIGSLNDKDAALIQRTVGSLLNPPALSKDMPKDAEFAQSLAILKRTPRKTAAAVIPNTSFTVVEISLVLQAIEEFDFGDHRNLLRARMTEVLRAMAKGNSRIWHQLSTSTELQDITIYSYLKDALQRAKSPNSSNMVKASVKRSQKRFWDGGVSV